MRLFNQREGFDETDDELPARTYDQPFSFGPAEGEHVDRDAFLQKRALYYDMAGLDAHGHPRHSKVIELDLQWAEALLRA